MADEYLAINDIHKAFHIGFWFKGNYSIQTSPYMAIIHMRDWVIALAKKSWLSKWIEKLDI